MPVLGAQPLHSILHYRSSCIAGYMLYLFLVLSHWLSVYFIKKKNSILITRTFFLVQMLPVSLSSEDVLP